MAHVIVKLYPGRTEEQKIILSDEIVKDVVAIAKCDEKSVFNQVLERSNGVLGFSKTKFFFEQKKIDQKLANGQAEQLFVKSAA